MMLPTSKPPLMINLVKGIAKANNIKIDNIFELPEKVSGYIFSFDYPLHDKINRSEFQTQIVEHYISRRIGQETFTAFQFALRSKMREIMPKYNALFKSLDGWDLFKDGETSKHTIEIEHKEKGKDTKDSNVNNNINVQSNGVTNGNDETRQSNTPQSAIDDVKSGTYLSYAGVNNSNATTNNNTTTKNNGTIHDVANNEKEYTDKHTDNFTRDVPNKIEVYRQFMEDLNSIYSMLYKDLDVLFYGLI